METRNYSKLSNHFINVLVGITLSFTAFSQNNSILQEKSVSVINHNQRVTGYIHDTSIDPFIVTSSGFYEFKSEIKKP
jgi:hypothetical protein